MLAKEKDNYTKDNIFTLVENEKIAKIINVPKLMKKQKNKKDEDKIDYILKLTYYDLDGRNIFKRIHRFQKKIFLLICFSYLLAFNVFEFIINIYFLVNKLDYGNDFDEKHRTMTLFLNMINIFIILILTTVTVVKRRIKTYIYY